MAVLTHPKSIHADIPNPLIPVIDLQPFLLGDAKQRQIVADEIGDARVGTPPDDSWPGMKEITASSDFLGQIPSLSDLLSQVPGCEQ